MDRYLASKFQIPAGSFGVFGILSMATTVTIYDRVVVPMMTKFTKRQHGLSLIHKERTGVGLAIGCVAAAVSAMVESKRGNAAMQEGLLNRPRAIVNMSAMWLVPQHCLDGKAEAFHAIGQIEFHYSLP